MGKINYSIAMRLSPADPEAGKKAYAVAQYTDKLNLEAFAKHITSHGSVYSYADILAVLEMTCECIRELLLEGYKIQLGNLGYFSVALCSKGAATAADFNTNYIKKVKVNWTPGSDLKNLRDDATFQQVASREIQASTLASINGTDKTDSTGD